MGMKNQELEFERDKESAVVHNLGLCAQLKVD